MDHIPTPRSTHAAHDDLRYIRQTLATAGHISAVPGWGLLVIGVLAFSVAVLDVSLFHSLLFLEGVGGAPASVMTQLDPAQRVRLSGLDLVLPVRWSIGLWSALLAASVGIGVWAMRKKARRMGQMFWSPVLRKAMWGYGAAMLLGAVLTVATFSGKRGDLLPEIWLGCYGVALISAGGYSVAPVRWMGLCFLLAAAGASVTPASFGLTWLALGFGWVHIAFGAYIAWRHDG